VKTITLCSKREMSENLVPRISTGLVPIRMLKFKVTK
jgi:hypothetical protein